MHVGLGIEDGMFIASAMIAMKIIFDACLVTISAAPPLTQPFPDIGLLPPFTCLTPSVIIPVLRLSSDTTTTTE
jgi:hypothetical protein